MSKIAEWEVALNVHGDASGRSKLIVQTLRLMWWLLALFFYFLRDQNSQHFNEDLLGVNASAFSFVLCFKAINYAGSYNYVIRANWTAHENFWWQGFACCSVHRVLILTRQLGILAMSREARGKQLDYLSERWFIQDGRANFVKLIPLNKNLNYYQEDLIDNEAPKSRKINSQTLSKGLWKTLFQALG